MKHHEDHDCPHRLVLCPHADCKASVQSHTLQHHLKFECESEDITQKYALYYTILYYTILYYTILIISLCMVI